MFVLFSTTKQPFGGANQFMRALKERFKKERILTHNVFVADIILFNSHLIGGPFGKVAPFAYFLKLIFPNKLFVHRVDGPIQMYGGMERAGIDHEIFELNNDLADGTVYQSLWSRDHNRALGMPCSPYEAVIRNASNPDFFFTPLKRGLNERVRLVAVSWSVHLNKGFEIYGELDRELDWSRFDMTFVGRSRTIFNNIKVRVPMSSDKLGEFLRAHDIFVTASRNDACPNSVVEALDCGLPVVARNSGGHPELVGSGGELFNTTEEAVMAIERVAKDLEGYRLRITTSGMEKVGSEYVNFFQMIMNDVLNGHCRPKQVSVIGSLRRIFRS